MTSAGTLVSQTVDAEAKERFSLAQRLAAGDVTALRLLLARNDATQERAWVERVRSETHTEAFMVEEDEWDVWADETPECSESERSDVEDDSEHTAGDTAEYSVHTCTHARARAHTLTHTCMHATHARTHMSIHMPIHMSTRMPTCMAIHISMHMSIYMPMHMPTHMPVRMSRHMPAHISVAHVSTQVAHHSAKTKPEGHMTPTSPATPVAPIKRKSIFNKN